MRAVLISKAGGPEVLQVHELPDPTPKPGEVRVRVHAAGLNFAEVTARQGLYPDAPPIPCVVGYEVAGIIDQLGAGVTEYAIGDRVLALVRFGGHAELVCAPIGQIARLPESISFELGAAMPVNYITAYHMLFRVGAVHPGERVLVHMAAGGVGIAALQLLKTVPNVEVFGTCSAAKHDVVRSEGCHHPIDYRTKSVDAEVKRLTNGQGVDLVLDALGGGSWRTSYNLLRPTGRLICFGFANAISGERANYLNVLWGLAQMPFFHPMSLMSANKGVIGVNLGHLWDRLDVLSGEITALMALWEAGKIAPMIDSVHTFEKAADAHRRIESRSNVGKVVLVP